MSIIWSSMEFYGIPWTPLMYFGRNYNRIPGNSMEVSGSPWNSRDFNTKKSPPHSLQKSMEFCGIPPFHGIPREVVWECKVLKKGCVQLLTACDCTKVALLLDSDEEEDRHGENEDSPSESDEGSSEGGEESSGNLEDEDTEARSIPQRQWTPPPSLESACSALEDVKNILKPRQPNGHAGYKDPHLPSWLWEQLDALRLFL